MKIAIVHSFYSSGVPSGENSAVLAQASALEDADNEVLLVSRSTDTEESNNLFKLRAALSASGLGGPSPLAEIAAFAPDIIHVHNLFPNFGTHWVRDTTYPVVTTLHNYRTICAAGSLFRQGAFCTDCMTRGSHRAVVHACYRESRLASVPLAYASRQAGRTNNLLRDSGQLITLNAHATEIFSTIVGSERVSEIPNFVDTGVADNSAPDVRSNKFVYAGRLTEEKGVDWLVANWPTTASLCVVGAGPMERVVQAAAETSSNIEYLGVLDSESTVRLMSRSAAVVIPSMWLEGIPTVALEAISTGTPVLISSRCASASDLTRGGAGVIFDPSGGKRDLERALSEISHRSSDRRQSALKLFSSRYSRSRWLSRIMALYGKMRADDHTVRS